MTQKKNLLASILSKLDQILCNKSLTKIRITDFGISTVLEKDKKTNMSVNVVTLWYRAPELLLQHPRYDDCIDIWSAGLIAVELNIRTPLFKSAKNEREMVQAIIDLMGVPSLPDKYPNKFITYLDNIGIDVGEKKFITTMLNLNMCKRAKAKDLINNEWLEKAHS